MKKPHKPEHWQFIELHPLEGYASTPVKSLGSEHAAGAYCRRCNCLLSYSKGQTTTVTRHMIVYHYAEINQYRAKHKKNRTKKLENKSRHNCDDTTDRPVVKITREQQKRANALLAIWLAKSQRPFSLVQDKGFLDYVMYITLTLTGLELEVPSRNAIAGEIRLLAVQLRATLKEQLKKSCQYFCLTTDIWTDRTMRSFMAVTLHYLDDKFNMYDWTLEVEVLPRKHTGAAIASALEKVLTRWGLEKSFCVRLVRDGASNAVSAGNHMGVSHASCLAHSLHLEVGGAMAKTKVDKEAAPVPFPASCPPLDEATDPSDSDDEYEANVASVISQLQDDACAAIEELIESRRADEQQALSKMRTIVQVFRSLAVFFRKSSKAKSRFLKIRKDEQPGCNAWLQVDCPTRWSSCHAMLTRFVELKATVENFSHTWTHRQGSKSSVAPHKSRPHRNSGSQLSVWFYCLTLLPR